MIPYLKVLHKVTILERLTSRLQQKRKTYTYRYIFNMLSYHFMVPEMSTLEYKKSLAANINLNKNIKLYKIFWADQLLWDIVGLNF